MSLRESAIIQWLKEHPDEIENGLVVVNGYWFQGDIFGLDREGYPVIIEVKRKRDTHSVAEGVGELLLYQTMLEEFFKESEANDSLEGILLAWSHRIASRKKTRDIKTQKIRKILIIPSEDNKMNIKMDTIFIKVCKGASIEIKTVSLDELKRR